MKNLIPIIFFGNEQLASGVTTNAQILDTLIMSDYEVGLVVISQNQQTSRMKKEASVLKLASKFKIPISSNDNNDVLADKISKTGAKTGVLAAYGQIVPRKILDLFEIGIINLHPSLLPKYRGSSPIESAILSDDSETGISLMKLVEKMDAGPIYATKNVVILNKTKQELHDELVKEGTKLLLNSLPAIMDKTLLPVQQSNTLTSYTGRLSKEDGAVDWSKPAHQLAKEVIAYQDWPGSKTSIFGKSLTIKQAHIASGNGTTGKVFFDSNQLGVFCKTDSLLLDFVQPESKKIMSGADFARGYSNS